MPDKKFSLEPYRDYVQPYHTGRDPAHTFLHIERILACLPALTRDAPGLRLDRLYFLACFHGLWTRLCEDVEFNHRTQRFLAGLDWTAEEIAWGLDSLEHHLRAPRCLEEEIVHDANYLETLGAYGLARAFTAGGTRGQTIEQIADQYENTHADTIQFRTPAGRELAECRREYAREFLRRLRGKNDC